jgi:hypothetical protein
MAGKWPGLTAYNIIYWDKSTIIGNFIGTKFQKS